MNFLFKNNQTDDKSSELDFEIKSDEEQSKENIVKFQVIESNSIKSETNIESEDKIENKVIISEKNEIKNYFEIFYTILILTLKNIYKKLLYK